MTSRLKHRAKGLKAPQNLAGGIALVSIAALTLWLTRDLDPGTLSAMGSGMLPHMLAWAVGLCGVALVLSAFLHSGERLERGNLQGPLLIILAIFAFSATIRPLTIGPVTTPGLGLIVAVPIAIIIGGMASAEARIHELVMLSLGLTPSCMLVFCDMLNLPIPVFPQAVIEIFPDGWDAKSILRISALVMIAAAVMIFYTSRKPVLADRGESE
ncbi:hypothetical protein J2T08_005458 [Neorhizobium galegae]|uniref:tripartite tricarboxylate transporter TctB family protein n=1 Tax=Neorhizobium galegae TaxID=399 RepID=UPI001AE2CB00|nr:tripartite tricarboxylate transporter TctB family protein [Neorhizobium galegae]MBP2563245.1 hypothetical protein [Neorhizobium galegae]MDQ0137514.1 hypothetical protein [Neorhizobium galegae]